MPTKLIEVALPLDAINAASVREKSIRHGHPSTLHLWWARRPLAAARAVIWASLVDDPSAHPDRFPTVEAQETERKRLFAILEDLVKWENSNNEEVLAAAKAEIAASCAATRGGVLSALLDPFAGGGAIPLEAQRLGLEAHAHDLNPVAMTINKAMIEIPPRFADQPPINPESRKDLAKDTTFPGATGLAADVLHYGKRMREEAFARIGHLYPKVTLPPEQGGGEATVIAWIWARTVKCPNPICGCEMPLVSTFILSKKKGKEAWIEPIVNAVSKTVTYCVQTGDGEPPQAPKTSRGAKFRCVCCGESTPDNYVRDASRAGKMGAVLMAVVADGPHGRIYLSPDMIQSQAACCDKPEDYPTQSLPIDPRNIWCVNYGLDTYDKLFTNRQLTALTTFSGLVGEAQTWAEADAIAAGLPDDHIPLREGGRGAHAYAEAIAVYLALGVSRMADIDNSFCSWKVSQTQVIHLFTRQAIPMIWDFGENNVFNEAAGDFLVSLRSIIKVLKKLDTFTNGNVVQWDARCDCGLRDIVISTDPPYYDNISYADLSDFFYVWLRRALRGIYPELYGTMLTPKVEELIASPLRQEGSVEKAKDFFEDGMLATCRQLWQYAREDIPVTIYYAYKQQESDQSGTASSGWETMLASIIKAGFAITGTWPMRTELANRSIARETNALASSIVLVCRKRKADAPSTTRRAFLMELRRELGVALAKMQAESIAPVDLAQSAIGPGMAVFSKYAQVLESDGTPMSVRTALLLINQELDLYLNAQGGELDTISRFCLDLYAQYAFNEVPFGVADTLARAKNVSVAAVAESGAVVASKGAVRLLGRDELPEAKEGEKEPTWVLCQRLTQAMAVDGLKGAADLASTRITSDVERARALAYRLFTLAELKKWTKEAYDYNALVSAWGEVRTEAEDIRQSRPEQLTLDI